MNTEANERRTGSRAADPVSAGEPASESAGWNVSVPAGPDAEHGFRRLLEIMRRLRAPDGCPWDREQTPRSLRAALIEEAYETVEAINENEPAHIREELGDLFLMAVMIAYIYEESGSFTVLESLNEVCEKLIRRHPHVFGEASADTPDAVVRQWEEIKHRVEGRRKKDSILDGVSRALPPLERAYKLQKKAAKAGFDWTEPGSVWDKIAEELNETREAWQEREADAADRSNSGGGGVGAGGGAGGVATGGGIDTGGGGADRTSADERRDHLEEELGDLLFSVVNVARFLGVDPAVALGRSSAKFERRFRYVEDAMRSRGTELGPAVFGEMDALWDEAKRNGL